MKRTVCLILVWMSASCASYHPLKDDKTIYSGAKRASSGAGVTSTFLGNTTILFSDGDTTLLVDGFLSRPRGLKTLFGKISPDRKVVESELDKAGVDGVDAILVGHAHHDHALDTAMIARMKGAVVMGSESYRFIHEGAGGDMDSKSLIVVPKEGGRQQFGEFTVTFVLSDHVSAHSFIQKAVEGDIKETLEMPARYSDFKCGDVFAIHIAHPHGNFVVTTTAGAKCGQLDGLRADVVFLGIGLLSKEPEEKQNLYWKETVAAVDPHTVIPVHWDNFSRKLSKGVKPLPKLVDDVEGSIGFVKRMAKGRKVQLMGVRDSFRIRNGVIQPSVWTASAE